MVALKFIQHKTRIDINRLLLMEVKTVRALNSIERDDDRSRFSHSDQRHAERISRSIHWCLPGSAVPRQ